MKKLINDPRNVVREMLEGLADMTPGLALLDTENVALRADLPSPEKRPVAVISGGGAGHEPAHAGYIGQGMLTAAVTGDVFTSPSVDAILSAIRASAGPAGALLVVKNYTGDRLNFGLAAELATREGIPTEIVVVADDVALAGIVARERRRGIAGTVLIHKIAGAAAAGGRSLEEVVRLARAASARLGTMGVALGACTVPAAGKPGFSLGDDEIELGLGIHGEKGVERARLMPADALVDRLVEQIVSDTGTGVGDRVAVLVNGLGATPPLELAIVARRTLVELRRRGIVVERAWSGNLLTALEMPGCSLTVLRLDDGDLDLLDAPSAAPAWPGSGRLPKSRAIVATPAGAAKVEVVSQGGAGNPHYRDLGLVVAEALEAAEPHLTELDSRAGDGDLGASMVRGAVAIRALPQDAWSSPATALHAIGDALRRAIAGSSGPFYAIALARAARRLSGSGALEAATLTDAFAAAVFSIGELGGAKPGDRTMLDALQLALEAMQVTTERGGSIQEAWIAAAAAAEDGARRTATMKPALGRASYMGDRVLGTPDGGAVAVSIWMQAIARAL